MTTCEHNSIRFDRANLAVFKRAYDEALRRHAHSFYFDGKEIVTGYAKFMIEYLEAKLSA